MISISQCSRKSIQLIYNTFWSQTFHSLLFYKVSKENLPSLCCVLKIYSFSYRSCQFINMKCSHCGLIMWTLIKVHVVQVKHICFFSVSFVQLGKWCMLHFFLSVFFIDKPMKQFFLFSFMFLIRPFTQLGTLMLNFSMVPIIYLVRLLAKVIKWNFTTNARFFKNEIFLSFWG